MVYLREQLVDDAPTTAVREPPRFMCPSLQHVSTSWCQPLPRQCSKLAALLSYTDSAAGLLPGRLISALQCVVQTAGPVQCEASALVC